MSFIIQEQKIKISSNKQIERSMGIPIHFHFQKKMI